MADDIEIRCDQQEDGTYILTYGSKSEKANTLAEAGEVYERLRFKNEKEKK